MKETNFIKSKRLSSVFSTEIAEILGEEIRNIEKNFLVTLIKVCIAHDMSLLNVYIRIYPFFNKNILETIQYKSRFYRKLLSKRLRYRVKKIPKIRFLYIAL
ncbi:ribosome-binding factor A [Blattabacterium cuenoti]|uniref:ribosome-binding factor A n=1 Tax=Blattabacterium cuenoti TaxID=1653831 RepID=UPI00163B7A2C|nr:ribosome-binding factor A [Blattabacterium cuenoti]